MKIYNNTQNLQNIRNQHFGSRFNTEIYQTQRALNCLKRTISSKKGLGNYFDDFILRLEKNNQNDILEITQFDKYYLITNTKNNKNYKIQNNNIIEKLESFILLHNRKKAPR